ncbi:MAG: hypothetical protein LBV01_01385 [Deltaproteobacteria bacterium]|jgi:hypothetical protein|nr:hypothetical protein [Deltaproteobacteria bacterium]
MRITIGNTSFDVDLYDNAAARSLAQSLPQEISMSRWGDEFYGSLKQRVEYAKDPLQDVFAVGEVALWPSGNALCIFFGPTPASHGSEPRMASPGVALGKIKGDIQALRSLGSSLSKVVIAE